MMVELTLSAPWWAWILNVLAVLSLGNMLGRLTK